MSRVGSNGTNRLQNTVFLPVLTTATFERSADFTIRTFPHESVNASSDSSEFLQLQSQAKENNIHVNHISVADVSIFIMSCSK